MACILSATIFENKNCIDSYLIVLLRGFFWFTKRCFNTYSNTSQSASYLWVYLRTIDSKWPLTYILSVSVPKEWLVQDDTNAEGERKITQVSILNERIMPFHGSLDPLTFGYTFSGSAVAINSTLAHASITILILHRVWDPGGAVNFWSRIKNIQLAKQVLRTKHLLVFTWYNWSGSHIAIMIRPLECIAILLVIQDANWAKSCSPFTDFGNVPVNRISGCTRYDKEKRSQQRNALLVPLGFPVSFNSSSYLLTSLCLLVYQDILVSWAQCMSPSHIRLSSRHLPLLPKFRPTPSMRLALNEVL